MTARFRPNWLRRRADVRSRLADWLAWLASWFLSYGFVAFLAFIAALAMSRMAAVEAGF